MHKAVALLAFAAAVHGQSLGLSDNDVPPECRSICQPVIDTERRCETSFDDDSQQYRDCVCQDQAAAAALSACEQCAAQYPNFFIDRDDHDGRGHNVNQGPDIDDNEIAAWARACGLPVLAPNVTGVGPIPTAGPNSTQGLGPHSFTTYSVTTTQIYDCNEPWDIEDELTPDNDDNNEPRCTRTTVVPIVGIATGTGVMTAPTGPTPTGVPPTRTSVSFTTSVGTDAAGRTATFTSAVATFTGAAALPTAAVGYFGAGAAALIAAFAL